VEEAWELAAVSRTAVPAALKRELMEEAGYRCAVPTCRQSSPLEMEHIEDWATSKAHNFEDMIVLCRNCHGRVTNKEIPKSSVRAFKRNLAVVNGRYTKFELSLLEKFHHDGAKAPEVGPEWVTIKQFEVVATSDYFHLKGLVDDGIVFMRDNNFGKQNIDPQYPNKSFVQLTPKGVAFVNNFFSGNVVE